MTISNVPRRQWLAAALLAVGVSPWARATEPLGVRRGRTLVFPRDHGAHPETNIEWWYLTGFLGDWDRPQAGFQVTFFRHRTGKANEVGGRFAGRQLLFAHAALTDLRTPGAARHVHDERLVRWSGQSPSAAGAAALHDGDVHIGPWRLHRSEAPPAPGEEGGSRWLARIEGRAGSRGEPPLQFALTARRTQPLLLQGDAGFSRKGPEEVQASHYVTEPQLAVTLDGRLGGNNALQGTGRGWLDHEWSDALMHPEAVGWDWIGMNLRDGAALTAFVLRRADGQALWAGGSHRTAAGALRVFGPQEVRFEPGRRWRSPATAADYPVQWTVVTPVGEFGVAALLDAQEVDGRRSTGTVYWEGLSALTDAQGRRVGLGYLEMTGYGQRLRLGT